MRRPHISAGFISLYFLMAGAMGAGRRLLWDCDFALEKATSEIRPLCYNAVTMQSCYRFANDNNNDNDDPRIVGRSLAG